MRDARVVTLKNRRMWCEMRRGATCCVGGARCVWVRDAHYNVISVLGVRDAYFLGGCESPCPHVEPGYGDLFIIPELAAFSIILTAIGPWP